MDIFQQTGAFVVVALLWGATNPFLKRGSQNLLQIKETSKVQQYLSEWKYMLTRPSYLVPFLLNQGGSLVYYVALSKSELSVAVPLTNSLTLLFTLLSGIALGEKIRRKALLGMVLVMVGIIICITSKSV